MEFDCMCSKGGYHFYVVDITWLLWQRARFFSRGCTLQQPLALRWSDLWRSVFCDLMQQAMETGHSLHAFSDCKYTPVFFIRCSIFLVIYVLSS